MDELGFIKSYSVNMLAALICDRDQALGDLSMIEAPIVDAQRRHPRPSKQSAPPGSVAFPLQSARRPFRWFLVLLSSSVAQPSFQPQVCHYSTWAQGLVFRERICSRCALMQEIPEWQRVILGCNPSMDGEDLSLLRRSNH